MYEFRQIARSNKVAANESLSFDYGKVGEVLDLTVDIQQMSPLSLNFWMTKLVGEIGNRSVLIDHPLQFLFSRISSMKLKQA